MCGVMTASMDGYVTATYGDPEKKWVRFCSRTFDTITENSLGSLCASSGVWSFRGVVGVWDGVIDISSEPSVRLRVE